jgi:predicted permease
MSLIRDLRFAIRQFRKNPGFTAITATTLALGIGATTAIFSLVNTVVLKPLPFPRQERLMALSSAAETASATVSGDSVSYPDFFDWRAQNHSFSAMASYRDDSITMTGRGEARQLQDEIVSAEFFHVLGVNPMLGRAFTYDEEKPHSNVVVLSYKLWQSSFGSSPQVIGQTVTLGAVPYTVIGVMPRAFTFPIENPAPDLWTTLALDSFQPDGTEPLSTQRGAHALSVIGRLKDGVSPQAGAAEMNVIGHKLKLQYPKSNTKRPNVLVVPELETLVGDSRPALRMLFAAVLFVLLIACANVAGLLLARGSQRRSEIALRAAMGATRWEIVRQLLVESGALAMIGGALGVLVAVLCLKSMVRFVPEDLPRLDQIAIDGPVLLFALGVSTLTGIVFGILPAWRISHTDPSQALRPGMRSTSDRAQHRLQNILVVAETAVGLVLLVGSGLLIHSFVRVLHVDPGFDSQQVLTASLSLPEARYQRTKPVQFYNEVMARVAALPGVKSAGGGWPVPLSDSSITVSFDVEGRSIPEGTRPSERLGIVDPNYFSTLHIPLLAGRTFTARDDYNSSPVVIITDTFAKKYFPEENPLGKHIQPGLSDGVTKKEVMREIVGVVGDVKAQSLTKNTRPQYYLPFAQAIINTPTLCIRTENDPASLIEPLRAVVSGLDPDVAVYEVKTLQGYVERSASQPRFQAMLLTSFAAIGLILFAVGLYAVLSYTVAQRTPEIGVRMALGARREDVLRMFLSQGITLACVGAILGIVASFALARLIANLLFGVKPTDPLVFAITPVLIAAIALLASFIPAHRAMRVEPMVALKYE